MMGRLRLFFAWFRDSQQTSSWKLRHSKLQDERLRKALSAEEPPIPVARALPRGR